MPRFQFEETCTSRPLYQIEADNLEAAVAAYRNGTADLVSEEVEHNVLLEIRKDGKSVAIPETLRHD